MKCPYRKREEFDKWSPECKECAWFDYCEDLETSGLGDTIGQEPTDMEDYYNKHEDEIENTLGKLDDNLGDNYPTYDTLHLKLLLNRERSSMVIKLLSEGDPKIHQDDIIDAIIDLEMYNKNCRKQKIKKAYKKRKKETK